MLLLKFRDKGTYIVAVVHLDETKVLEDGSPDPVWVRRYEYSTAEMTLARVKVEIKRLAQAELATLQAGEGTALAGEGQAL